MTESEFGQCRRSVGRIQDVSYKMYVLYVAEPGPAPLPAGKGTQEATSRVAEPGPAPPAAERHKRPLLVSLHESRDGSSRPRPAHV
jgi:hypothetical protein